MTKEIHNTCTCRSPLIRVRVIPELPCIFKDDANPFHHGSHLCAKQYHREQVFLSRGGRHCTEEHKDLSNDKAHKVELADGSMYHTSQAQQKFRDAPGVFKPILAASIARYFCSERRDSCKCTLCPPELWKMRSCLKRIDQRDLSSQL